MIGKTLGHFRVGEQLGRGGMGEVYTADDLHLNRRVALKFLPEAFAGDPERMARFEREAKLLASLNHPNIAAIYGLEQAEGKRFLVLELVEGETLAQRIDKGPLPVDESLALCRQIAEGLEAAHENGVIHRDLKPANVMITGGDKVKILDFGLAKALSDETQRIDSSQSPTLTEAMTRPGVILGTAAYMSPEQAKGKSVDKRTDIWAFGCILYECLTGRKVFEGETITETLASILKSDPYWQALPATTPHTIRVLLHRCLQRDAGRRFRDAADVRIEIDEAGNTAATSTASRSLFPRAAWCIAAVCFTAALVFGYLYFRQAPAGVQSVVLEVNTPPTSEPSSLAISPDGRSLAYVASTEGRQQLWLRRLDERIAIPLAGTEGATFPFWSPDSKSVGFFAAGKLKRIDIGAGGAVTLADAPDGAGGTWNRDGVIVFTPNIWLPLHRVPATGGDPVAVTRLKAPDQISHNFPCFLPDGRHILYYAWGEDTGVHLASLDTGETKKLFHADSPAIFARPGYLLFLRQASLFAQPFDDRRGELAGDRFQVADPVGQHEVFNQGGFSVSETGVLAYRMADAASRSQLIWFDRSGKETGAIAEPGNSLNPELSPGEDQIAVDKATPGVESGNLVWLMEVARGVSRRFTHQTRNQLFPVWSPDASRIVFSTMREGRGAVWDLHQMPSNGSGNAQALLEPSSAARFANDWSRDGRFLLYTAVETRTGRDLWVLPMSGGEREPFPFMATSAEEQNGQFSPDARWIAYQSDESGRFEIYAQSFPASGARVAVSTSGGMQPRWHPGGNELMYIAPDGMLMAAPLHISGNTLSAGAPVTLFPSRIQRGGFMDIMRIQYALSRDGKRILVNTSTENSAPAPIIIETQWAGSAVKQ